MGEQLNISEQDGSAPVYHEWLEEENAPFDNPHSHQNVAASEAPRRGKVEGIDTEMPRDVLSLYFREINKEPLLDADTEKELSRTIKRGYMAKEDLEVLQTDEHGLEITEDERKAIERQIRQEIEEGDQAFTRFVNANLRLVVWAACRYKKTFPNNIELGDLIQSGNEGLMKAVEKFDPDYGFKFSTYAPWWIRHKMQRGVANYETSIRIPYHRHEAMSSIRSAYNESIFVNGQTPSVDELSEKSGVSKEHVLMLLPYIQNRQTVSLNQPLGPGATSELGEVLASEVTQPSLPEDKDDGKDNESEMHLRDSTNPVVLKAQSILNNNEWSSLCEFYDLQYRKSYTTNREIWEEIASNRGIKPDSARRTVWRALGKLRKEELQQPEYEGAA